MSKSLPLGSDHEVCDVIFIVVFKILASNFPANLGGGLRSSIDKGNQRRILLILDGVDSWSIVLDAGGCKEVRVELQNSFLSATCHV